MTQDLIPFGKYKGQPLEAIQHDRQYLEWLTAQPWFREKYQNIYTLIINNFTEPTETPEHNALQVLFLDEDYCYKFINHFYADRISSYLWKEFDKYTTGVFELGYIYKNKYKYVSPCPKEQVRFIYKLTPAAFEVNGFDVCLTYSAKLLDNDGKDLQLLPELVEKGGYSTSGYEREIYTKHNIWIEIKPTIGDDYPAVLRQIKNIKQQGHTILFVDQFNAKGATKDQFIQTFNRSNIHVVFKDEI